MKQDAVKAIEKLVLAIAEKAAKSAKNLSEQMEAARVLAPYYTALKKHKVHATSDEPDEVTIGHLQDAVRDIEDGNGRTVSHHKRRAGNQAAVED
jgi:hypothetical protein